jgi:hypothetical protein
MLNDLSGRQEKIAAEDDREGVCRVGAEWGD